MRRNLIGLLALAAALQLSAQQVPPSIVAEGVPEMPRELVRKLNPYQNIRGAAFNSWHPARRQMLISTRFADTMQIHLVKAPGGYRQQLTFFREPVSGARFSPQPGKNWFVFSMDEGGAEFYQLYRFDLGSGAYDMLTDGKAVNSPGPFSNRGDRVAFTSTRRNGRDFDIYVMDPEKPATTRLVCQAQGQWFPVDWSPDDRRLLALEYISINESYLHVLDVATGKVEPLLPGEKEKAFYGPARWSKDGKGVYLPSDRESEFTRLWYLDLASKELTCLTEHIPWDIEGMDLTSDGSRLAFTANEDGIGKLHLMNTATRQELPPPKLPLGQVYGLRFHRTLKELALGLLSAKSPGDVYSYNHETGQLTRWTYSEAGGLDPNKFPETRLIHYPTFDQVNGKARMIPAFVTKPRAGFKPPYPVLIDIHGGPEGQARPGLNAPYALNELGVAIIEPNVRGSSGYGKTYLKLDNAMRREDSVKDIGALLDWVAAQPDLDAKRVAVTGGSYGGYMSLATMVHYSDRLRCGIDVVGVSHWVTFLKNTQAYRQDLRRAEYGDERDPKMREFLESISPLNNAQKIRVPVLVVQGKNDPRVPVTESGQMVRKIRDNGGTVWYVMAQDEGHGFRKKQNRDYQTWAEIMFLEQYLLK
jgi:dipeptidyl aminopeptidase/acylaminoacyl peptidase